MRVVCGYSCAIEELGSGRPLPGRSDEILCYGPEPAPLRWDPAVNSYAELAAQFPAGWKPDALFCASLEYVPVPVGIEEADCFTVGIVGDWNLGAQAVGLIGGAFDLLVADGSGCERLRSLGFDNVVYAPLWGYDPRVFRRLPGVKRDLDIVLVGNFNHEVQRERARWLARVARMSRKHRVCLTSGIYGEDYVRLLNRARIVFNRSIRGEINMRVYEAAACGALLMYERENGEIRDLFRDGKECVLYDDDLEERIEWYLSNDDERERIAEAAARRVRGHTWAHSSAQILDAVEAAMKTIEIGANRTLRSLPEPERALGRACQWLLTPTHGGTRALDALAEMAGDPDSGVETDNAVLLNALACAQAEAGLAMTEGSAGRASALRSAVETISRALALRPGYVAAEFNRAHFLLAHGESAAAEEALRQAVTWLRAGELRVEQLHGPYPTKFDSFRTELEAISATCRTGTETWIAAMRSLLVWRSAELLSDLAYESGDLGEALAWARTAVSVRPDLGATRYRLARALFASGNLLDAETEYRHALADGGLFPQVWSELGRLLLRTRQAAECRALFDEIESILDGCPVYYWFRPELASMRKELESIDGANRHLRLLAFADWNDDADWQGLIREYAAAFSSADPVTLLLPVDTGLHPATESVVQRLEEFAVETLKRSLEELADITLLADAPVDALRRDSEVVLVVSSWEDSAPAWAPSTLRISRGRLADARRFLGARKAA
jgi:tetratricopeptide (TPR) repeat protein